MCHFFLRRSLFALSYLRIVFIPAPLPRYILFRIAFILTIVQRADRFLRNINYNNMNENIIQNINYSFIVLNKETALLTYLLNLIVIRRELIIKRMVIITNRISSVERRHLHA